MGVGAVPGIAPPTVSLSASWSELKMALLSGKGFEPVPGDQCAGKVLLETAGEWVWLWISEACPPRRRGTLLRLGGFDSAGSGTVQVAHSEQPSLSVYSWLVGWLVG